MQREYINEVEDTEVLSASSVSFIEISEKTGVVIGQHLLKAIEDGKSSALFFALILAAIIDLSDLAIIGQIPGIGTFIKLIATPALTLILWNVGGFIKWKVRFLLWAVAPPIEIIPILATWPTYTLAILWAYFKIQKRAEEAEIELSNTLVAANNPTPEPDWDSFLNQSPKRTIRPRGIPYT